jgi:hypothetical protein
MHLVMSTISRNLLSGQSKSGYSADRCRPAQGRGRAVDAACVLQVAAAAALRTSVLPQVDYIPEGEYKYFRTVWTDSAQVGKGFNRMTNVFTTSAISYNYDAALERRDTAVTATQDYSMIENASDFETNMRAGGNASIEGWGAKVSAAYETSTQTKYSETSITLSLRKSYISKPVTVIQPTKPEQKVALTDEAYNYLKTNGPIKFHNKYGSHFVSGYTFGAPQDSACFWGCYMHDTRRQSGML